MKITQLLTLLLLLSSFGLNARTNSSSHNKFLDGKRTGIWYLNAKNEAVSENDPHKVSEGRFINGRKEGVWIYYYEDGQTPRLIGEYSDNRPSGTYFRFNRQGKMCSANANTRILENTNRVGVSNNFYTCQLNFENQDLIAGQVFFTHKLFHNNSYRFWNTKSFETTTHVTSRIDFTWLHNSYNSIYAAYLEVRKPSKKTDTKKKTDNSVVKPVVNKLAAPFVKNPIVADGLDFKPNGMNKLYTKTGEIWMDGYFENGQLRDGKVFLYDHDGVLLKVRVYKKSKFFADGGL